MSPPVEMQGTAAVKFALPSSVGWDGPLLSSPLRNKTIVDIMVHRMLHFLVAACKGVAPPQQYAAASALLNDGRSQSQSSTEGCEAGATWHSTGASATSVYKQWATWSGLFTASTLGVLRNALIQCTFTCGTQAQASVCDDHDKIIVQPRQHTRR